MERLRRLCSSAVWILAFEVVLLGGAWLGFRSISVERRTRVLTLLVRGVDRLLAPYRHRVAYQPVFRRLELAAARGFGSGLDGPTDSGEAYALSLYAERLSSIRSIVIVDGGAFEGEFTTAALAAFRASRDLRVVAFEPAPPAFERLKKNFAPDPRVVPVAAALGEKPGHADLHIDPSPKMNSIVNRLGLEGGESVSVPVTTLDNYCHENSIDHIDLLKLDIEGYEFNALQGTRDLLSRRAVSIVQFEFGAFSAANRVLLSDIAGLLHDYDIFRIVGDGLVPVSMAPEKVAPRSYLEPVTGGNYAAFLKP